MGLGKFEAAIRNHQRIGLDSCLLIYFLEWRQVYGDLAEAVFGRVFDGRLRAVFSVVAMTELLVAPYRAGLDELIESYRTRLTQMPNTEWIHADPDIAEVAAMLRGRHPSSRTSDALHVATAIRTGATAFVNNDARIRDIRDIALIQMEDFVA